jgi:hypothetical protein
LRNRRYALKFALPVVLAALCVAVPVSTSASPARAHTKEAVHVWKSASTHASPNAPSDQEMILKSHELRLLAYANAVNGWQLTSYAAAVVSATPVPGASSASATTATSTTLTSGSSTPQPAAVSASNTGYPSVAGALQGTMWQCIELMESGDNPSVTSGLYGDLNSTWANYDGYPTAGSAPLSVQNDFNAALQARDGWAPWVDSCTGFS